MVNGKQKGASFERSVCRELSLWMSQGKNEDLYWRSAMSGGRATVAAAKGKFLSAQSGDISAVHILGMPLTNAFLVECKFYRDLNFTGLLTRRGKLAEFWLEARKQAIKYKKLPMLVAKQNNQPVIVCLSKEGQALLRVKAAIMIPPMGLRILHFEDMLKTATRPT